MHAGFAKLFEKKEPSNVSASKELKLPSGAWDCHLHILDPKTYPYKASRTYTPAAATLEQLMSTTLATNFLLVQASVEDGETGFLKHLQRASTEYPDKTFRAEIQVPTDRDFTTDEIKQMNDLGVRCVRLHGEIGNTSDDPMRYIRTEFERLARTARASGWTISAMNPLKAWIEVIPWLMSNDQFSGIKFMIEHNARLDPKRNIHDYPELQELFSLLDRHKDRFFIKLCGINRLELESDLPGKMKAIPAGTLAIAERFPDNVVWGSDWPHVESAGSPREEEVPNKEVDLVNELSLLQQALPADRFEKLLVHNPSKFFK